MKNNISKILSYLLVVCILSNLLFLNQIETVFALKNNVSPVASNTGNLSNNQVQQVSSVVDTIDSTAEIEGYVGIFFGEKNTSSNNYVLENTVQSEVYETFQSLQFTLIDKYNSSNTKILTGKDVFIPFENGRIAIKDENGRLIGHFKITVKDFDIDKLKINGEGYIQKITKVSLVAGKTANISSEKTPITLIPGDVDQNGIINSLDYDLWRLKYQEGLKGKLSRTDIMKADYTKDGIVDNVDFSVWYNVYHLQSLINPPIVRISEEDDTKVDLSWNAVENADYYNIKRGVQVGQYDVIATNIKDTRFIDTTIEKGTTYYYVISASNSVATSKNSNEVVHKAVPKAPKLFGNRAQNSVRLNWTKANGADRYDVYRSTVNGSGYYIIGDDIIGNSYQDLDIKDGQKYYYVVKSVNEKGESEYSNQIEISNSSIGKINYKPNIDDDGDGLSNLDEVLYATSPTNPDTDNDGLNDGYEVQIGTDAINPDSDGDGFFDGAEVAHGTDPLTIGNEKDEITQKQAKTNDGKIKVDVQGNMNFALAPLQVKESDNVLLNSADGIIGKAIEISAGGFEFENATITLNYDVKSLNGISEDELGLFYVNRNTKQLELLNNIKVDKVNKTVSADTTHFSSFLFGKKSMPVNMGNVDIIFVIDQSGSMVKNDPNFRRIEAVQTFVNAMDTNRNRIGIVEFSESSNLIQGLTNDKNLLSDKLNSVKYTLNSTNLKSGLVTSETLFTNDDTRKVIIFLSDGVDGYTNWGIYTRYSTDQQILDQVKKLRSLYKGNQSIMLNTIALGSDTDVNLLTKMSEYGMGGYYFINDSGGLSQEDVDRQINDTYVKLSKQLTLQQLIIDRSSQPNAPINLEYSDLYNGTDASIIETWNNLGSCNLLTGTYNEQTNDLELKSQGFNMVFERSYSSSSNNDKSILGNGFRMNYYSSLDTKDDKEYNVVSTSYLSIRKNVDDKTTEIARVTKGTELEIVGETTFGNIKWYKVKYNDKEGFVPYWTLNKMKGIKVTYPSGSKIIFKKNGDMTYSSCGANCDTLEKIGDQYIITKPDQSKMIYDSSGKMVSLDDKYGNRIRINFEGDKITSVLDPVGREIKFSYKDGFIETIIDSDGRTVNYKYDDKGNLVSVKDVNGAVTKYEYDEHNRVYKIIDGNGDQVNRNIYDVLGRLVRQYDGRDNIKYYIYDNEHRERYIIDPNGNESLIKYSMDLKPISELDAEGREVKFSNSVYFKGSYSNWYSIDSYNEIDFDNYNVFFDTYFNVIMQQNCPTQKVITDRNGNTSTIQMDDRGNTIQITNPDGGVKAFEYDLFNNLKFEKDELGIRKYYIYDSENKYLLKVAQPLNGTDNYIDGSPDVNTKFAITSYTYYASPIKGLLKTSTDPENNMTTYNYDKYGNFESIVDPENNKTLYEYNVLGLKVSETSPKTNKKKFSYTEKGELLSVYFVSEKSETQSIFYDKIGNKIAEYSPNVNEEISQDSNQQKLKSHYGYKYTYYPNRLLKTVTDPEGYTTSYNYDSNGNKIYEKKPNGAIYLYEYDVLNRLIRLSFKEDENGTKTTLEEYTYDIVTGKSISYDKNLFNLQKTKKQYLNNEGQIATTIFIYDEAGRNVEQKNPDNSRVQVVYNKNGTENYKIFPNSAVEYYGYDGLNRRNQIWTPFEETTEKKYIYQKINYDKATRKISEMKSKVKVLYGEGATLDDKQLYVISYDYYPDGMLKEKKDNEGRHSKYYYDLDNSIEKEEVHTDSDRLNVVEYENNYLGKPVKKHISVRMGDLYGNSFENSEIKKLTTVYTYDKNGNVQSIQAPGNISTYFVYDRLDRLKETFQEGTDEAGNKATYRSSKSYNWEGKVLTETDPKMNTTQYSYNKQGFLESIVDAENGVRWFSYDKAGRLKFEVSPQNYISGESISNMNATGYTYDAMGRIKTKFEKYKDPVTSEWKTVVTKAYKYDLSGNVIKELNALGYQSGSGDVDGKISSGYGTEFKYNLANKVTEMLDPDSKDRGLKYSVAYQYIQPENIVSEVNVKGVITTRYYDAAQNLLSKTIKKTTSSPEVTIEKYTYDLVNNKTSSTDGNGNITKYEYNAFNKLKKATLPGDESIASSIKIYQYSVNGNVKSEIGFGRNDLYTYDIQGRDLSHTIQKTDGSEKITTYKSYDLNGNVISAIDGNGVKTVYEYDKLNKVLNQTTENHKTAYVYNKDGKVLSTSDWKQNSITNIYDPLNRLIEKKDPNGKIIESIVYNDNGMQTESIDALKNVTQFKYDKNSRLIQTIDPEQHKVSQTYDVVGNVETKTDGKNNKTIYRYDELNRVVEVENAKKEITSYTYDLNNNLRTQKDGKGQITAYAYNPINKVKLKTDQAELPETFEYFEDGNLKSKTDRNGKKTSYMYYVQGWIKSESVGAITIAYTYDSNGNQLTVTDATGTTVRTYDKFNRVLTKQVPNIGVTNFTYDITDNLVKGYSAEKTVDPKGNITTKVFDNVGRVKKVIDGNLDSNKVTEYDYFDNGSKKSVTYSGGLKEEYSYYKNNSLKNLTNKRADGSMMDSYTYTYDEAGNQDSKQEIINGIDKGTTKYIYDSLNRLESVKAGKETSSYTYDAAGNRDTETITESVYNNKQVATYKYNSQNRLDRIEVQFNGKSIENSLFTYDKNGNQLTVSKSVYTDAQPSITVNVYDDLNRMVSTVTPNKTKIQNLYNGEGLRVAKTVNGSLTRYLYEYDKVVLEIDGAGNQIARNIYGTNLLSRAVGNESYSYMYNGHADVTALITESGKVAATYYYDAFGNIKKSTGNVNNNIRYAGYQYDKETGLYYLNARMYDPKLARFLQEDTYAGDVNDPLSLNLYTYCANNPVSYYDPSGHFWNIVIGAVAGLVIGVGGAIISDALNGQLSWNNLQKYAGAGVQGLIIGGVAGATMGASLGLTATLASGVAAGAVGNVANQTIRNGGIDKFSFKELAVTTVSSGFGILGGQISGSIATNMFNNATTIMAKTLIGGLSGAGGGMAGSASGNIVSQSWDIATHDSNHFDLGSFASETAFGTLLGFGIGAGFGYAQAKFANQRPYSGEDWYNYLKNKYGNENVEWVKNVDSKAIIRQRVLNNIAESQAARKASNISEYFDAERNLLSKGTGNAGVSDVAGNGIVNGKLPASRLADKLQSLSNSKRPNTVAVIRTQDGRYIVGRNSGGVMNENVSGILDDLGNVNMYNKKCAEVNAISRAMNKGVDLEGATISVSHVTNATNKSGLHGLAKAPCDVCQPLLDYLKIIVNK
jgi:RHS repeat-associated protein